MPKQKSNLKGAGPGRPKGSMNKVSKDLKESYMQAFDGIGGVEALIKWAKKNQDEFYKLMTKLFPRPEVNVEVQQAQAQQINMTDLIREAKTQLDNAEKRRNRREQLKKEAYGKAHDDEPEELSAIEEDLRKYVHSKSVVKKK